MEEKIAQLKEFIARFSSNASKAKQATSRKKQLDKLQVEDIKPSSRRYPYVGFTPAREIGNEVLEVHNLTKTIDGVKVLDDVSFRLENDEKTVFMGDRNSYYYIIQHNNGRNGARQRFIQMGSNYYSGLPS